MFNVGGIQATIEIAGEALANAALTRLRGSLEQVDGAAAKAGTGLAKVDSANAKTTSSSDKAAAATKKQSDQAAALDDSLGKNVVSATAAAGATDKVAEASESAAEGIEGVGEASEEAGKKQEDAGNKAVAFSKKQTEAMAEVGEAGLKLGTAIAAGVGVAIYRFADFDRAMSEVQAASGETGAAYEDLRQNALQLGADSSFSAKEAAQGQAELAKAGVSTAAIIGGGLKGSLDLAAAGTISVADAAEVAATAMTQFRLSGEDVPHLADLLAAGANKAQGGVGDLGMALKQSGLVASQMGLSVEETVGTLTAFASAGLIGSDAGTSFRTMLLSLANPSKESAKLMKDLGISAYDANGELVGSAELAGQLQSSLSGLTQQQRDSALATIFGSDAIRAANVLYTQGQAGIEGYIGMVNDAGAAARTAAILQDNLAGDVEKLGGAFDSLLISSGGVANGPLRALIQGFTSFLDVVNDLPDGVGQTVVVLGVAAAGLLLLGGAALVAVPRVIALRTALQTLSTSGSATRGALSGLLGVIGNPFSAAFAAAAIAVSLFVAQQMRIKQASTEITASLDQATGATTAYTRELVAKKLAEDGAFDAAKAAGVSQKELTDAVLEGGAALDAVSAKLDANNTFGSFFTGQGIAAGNAKDRILELGQAVQDSDQAFRDQAAATEEASTATEGLGDSTSVTADSISEAAATTEDYRTKLQDLITAIMDYNSINQSAEQANIALQQSYADLDQRVSDARGGVEGFGLGIDVATQAGRDNRSALIDMAQASQEAAQKALDAGGSVESFRGSLESGRQKLVDYARQLGASDAQADALADAIFKIPTEKQFTAIANTSVAIQNANALAQAIQNIPSLKQTTITQMIKTTGADPGAVKSAYNANGGMYLSRGNEVVRHYADGGFENHTAQIFSAGVSRVFREPETGGEIYAPLAQSKRPRSREILAQGASMFGDHYLTGDQYDALAAGAGTRQSVVGLRMEGTATMGDGLEVLVRGVVTQELTAAADEAVKGYR